MALAFDQGSFVEGYVPVVGDTGTWDRQSPCEFCHKWTNGIVVTSVQPKPMNTLDVKLEYAHEKCYHRNRAAELFGPYVEWST